MLPLRIPSCPAQPRICACLWLHACNDGVGKRQGAGFSKPHHGLANQQNQTFSSGSVSGICIISNEMMKYINTNMYREMRVGAGELDRSQDLFQMCLILYDLLPPYFYLSVNSHLVSLTKTHTHFSLKDPFPIHSADLLAIRYLCPNCLSLASYPNPLQPLF